MARVKLRYIVGCPGLKNRYQGKGLLRCRMYFNYFELFLPSLMICTNVNNLYLQR